MIRCRLPSCAYPTNITVERGSVYLTGIQALVRLPMDQMRRDRRAGLKTGTFISGYEGSPLGGYDLRWRDRSKLLDEHNIVFPSRRERGSGRDLRDGQPDFRRRRQSAKSMAWSASGTAKVRASTVPATFSATPIWPARERTAPRWCWPATIIAAKAPPFRIRAISVCINVGIPFLYPGNTQEIIDYGLLAIALSRFSGAWVGLKMVTDICDGGGTVIVDPDQPAIRIPEGYQKTVDARLVPPITLALEHEVNVAPVAGGASSSRG